VFGVLGLVRWYTVRPADGALQWFDEKGAQDMFCSTTATKMLRHLKVALADGVASLTRCLNSPLIFDAPRTFPESNASHATIRLSSRESGNLPSSRR
jgi:hypothetical protein